MTPEQIKKIIADNPGAINLVKSSHTEKLSELYEAHVEVLHLRKDQFHEMSGYTYVPKKETIDTLASAAGIEFVANAETTRKEGENVYVGTAQAAERSPDGTLRAYAVCEYEFDVDVRHEEDLINDETAKYPKYHVNGVIDKTKSRRHWLELKKAARARANTGARGRAVLSVLGTPTGFKHLFGQGESVKRFLVSRIIVNTKNKMVLDAMLRTMSGNAGMLYGSSQTQIEAPAERPAQAIPVDRSTGGEEAPPSDQGGEYLGPDGTEDRTRFDVVEMLCQLRDENDWQLHPTKLQTVKDTINNADSIPVEKLEEFHDRVKGFIVSGAISEPPQGAAS